MGQSSFDLAPVYVHPQGALGKGHAAIRDDVLGAMDPTSGHRAVLMGDVNCDLRDSSPGAYAWGHALSATGYVAIG